MCHLPSINLQRPATLTLALSLLIWAGLLAPLERTACAHDSPGRAVGHETGLCALSCASNQEDVAVQGTVPTDAKREADWRESRIPIAVGASFYSRSRSRGPPWGGGGLLH